MNALSVLTPYSGAIQMTEKNNLDKYTGILFELKIGLNKDNAMLLIMVVNLLLKLEKH